MNIVNVNGKFLVDSRDVAEMTGKQHTHLLRDIDSYIEAINKSTNPKLDSLDFFLPGTYVDGKGQTRRKIDCSRKGCDLIANKMTGEKGILFTAVYATKFEEMEKRQKNNVEVLSERKALIQSLKLTAELAEEIEEIKVIAQSQSKKLVEIEARIEEQITLDSGDQRTVQKAVARRVYELESDPSLRSNLFRQLHREIKDRWAVASYRDVRRNELNGLLSYINAWRPIAA
jgi:Rha family phage regulatory protein